MKTLKYLPFALLIALGSCKKKVAIDPTVAQQAQSAREAELKVDQMEKNAKVAKTTLEFDKSTYDFGDIPFEEPVSAVFKVKNTGDNPLVIFDARPTCGCTISDKPTDPILPGKEGEIKIKFTPNHPEGGIAHKEIIVMANTVEGKHSLRFTANVAPKKK